MGATEAAGQLQSREQLSDQGMSNRAIAADVAEGRLVKVHTGWFVRGSAWRAAQAEARHRLQVLAAHRQLRGADPFVLCSAAVLHDLPLHRISPRRVHMASLTSDGRTRPPVGRRPLVARHEMRIPDSDLCEVDGIVCTTRERTVFDLARLSPREAGISVADAALRQVAWDSASWAYATAAAGEWHELMRTRVMRAAGARGIRRARFILPFADGRAQLPGESVSRLYLADMGFHVPRLQVPIRGPDGTWYYVDFDLGSAWGEFDGRVKYKAQDKDDAMAVLQAEKERQDWIHGTTHRPIARWGFAHMPTAAALARRLAAFGVYPRR
ncbi:hypothetical protein [Microbacterium sp.]|uniref:hypothetical protein n=1 Tax=Microbacterium sp. TaxID=51671 RepID=UPI0037C975CE